MTRFWLSLLLLAVILECIVCPPVTVKKTEDEDEERGDEAQPGDDPNFGLEYERYLKEIVGVLESDEAFRKKLEDSNISEIKSHLLAYKKYMDEVMGTLVKEPAFLKRIKETKDLGKESGEIARHLEFVSHNIRSRLDEIKRKEIDRLRQAMKLQMQIERGMHPNEVNPNLPRMDKEKILSHVDHKNPNSFEIEDLAKLIQQATRDLEDIDHQRRKEFKRYEMEKEIDQRDRLKEMDEEHRKEEMEKLEEMKKKHADHPKLHHPGSKDQLEEVWEDGDGMNKEDFNPRTFFALHDSNGDRVLDEAEVEALFQTELDKIYDRDNPEDDLVERYEEMNRMREHVFNEVDKNKNKLIELDEFIQSTGNKEFEQDEGWNTLEEEKQYTDEELEDFVREYEERQRQQYEQQGHRVPQHASQPQPIHDNLNQGQGHPVQMDQQRDTPQVQHGQQDQGHDLKFKGQESQPQGQDHGTGQERPQHPRVPTNQ